MHRALIILTGVLIFAGACGRAFPWSSEPDEVAVVRARIGLDGFVDALSPENADKFVRAYLAMAKNNDWPPSAARFFNLGNAHFLADQLPEAILAYHRGLCLDPNDSGLRENLDYARARVHYPFGERGRPEEDSWPPWLYRPSSFQLLAVVVLLYGSLWVLATRWFMTRRRALVLRAIVVSILAVVGGFLWVHFENERAWQAQHPLVVVRDDKAPLRKGNGPSYSANPDLPVLSRGMEARKINERGGWLQVQFAGGEAGWVEKSAVLVDEP
jgi:hypothetical protein